MDSDLSKKLAKFYPLRIALYGAENWTLRKEYREYLELLKCCVGEGAEDQLDHSRERSFTWGERGKEHTT